MDDEQMNGNGAAPLVGYTTRPLTMADAPMLAAMLDACASVDGATAPQTVTHLTKELTASDLGRDSVAIFVRTPGGVGAMVAACWLRVSEQVKSEYRFFINGRVHPEWRERGLGAALLNWSEQRARELAPAVDGRRQVMRLDFFDRAPDAIALFEQHGFHFAHAEDEMRRRLDESIPATSTTAALGFTTWAAATAARFFAVYDEAFSTRPGSPGWSEDVWGSALTDDEEFRPDLSLLVSVAGEDVGYAITHVEPPGGGRDYSVGQGSDHHLPEVDAESIGWIVQMGVRPEWRRKGIAGALLATLLQRYQIAGLQIAALSVNINNPGATSVYARLGFRHIRRYTSYQKVIRAV